MKEVFENLFICSQLDCERNVFDEKACSFVFAAKNPWHKEAVGYTGKSCDKNHPEYLWAYRDRGSKLILNMVDAPSSLFFSKQMVDEALNFIEEELFKGKNVFICCNKGESRSASLGLLFLIKQGHITGKTLEDCEVEYLRIYPNYNPGKGIREFVKENFYNYKAMSKKEDFVYVDESAPFTDAQAQFLERKLSDKKSDKEYFRKEYLCEFHKINEKESFMRKVFD